VEHLSALTWKGDKDMHTFRSTWDFIIKGMKDTFGDATLRDMLERKIRASKELSEDLSHYDRCPEGHEDHTLKFLWECINRAIGRQQMLRNRNDRDALVGKGKGGDPNALPGEAGYLKPKGKAKAEAKTKAKGEAKTKAKGDPKPKDKDEAQRGRSRGREKGDAKPLCFFHNQPEGCKKGKDCNFDHRKATADEKKDLARPSRSGSPGKGSEAGSGKGAGRGEGGGRGRGRGDKKPTGDGEKKTGGSARQWCAYHLKVEGCTKGDSCKFPHLDVSAVNAIKKAQLAQRG
jgi:hypothetical protein